MGLTDAVKEVVEDLNKRKNKSEVWETLEKKLKKAGFKDEYNQMIQDLNSYEAYEFLKVWDAINENFNKKQYTFDYKRDSFEKIKTLSKLDDIEEVIKTVAHSGYGLYTIRDMDRLFGKIYFYEDDVKIFKVLAKDSLYKRYDSVFKALNKLGYKKVNNYKSMYFQVEFVTNLASLEGDVVGAIYILANNGYRIDETFGLNRLDIKGIERILKEDEKEKSEGKDGIPIYLYNTGNLELFQDYFTSLKIEDKKSVLNLVLNHESKEDGNKQIQEWLEKNYESLLREVGFED